MHAKNLLFHRIMLPRVETRGYLYLTHVVGHFSNTQVLYYTCSGGYVNLFFPGMVDMLTYV